MKPFIESHDIQADERALRRRANCDGYLFFRNLVDSDAILEARRDIATTLQSVNWIDQGTDPFEAITSHPGHVSGEKDFSPVYDMIQRIESFHTLAHDHGLFKIMEVVLGTNVLLQPSNIARMIFPSRLDHTTPPHQDYVNIQGTPDVWTAWIPLGDCPRKLGGLSLLPGSHRAGILPMTKSLGAGGKRSDLRSVNEEWVSSPFNLGDILFFHSYTVHQGLPNLSGNRLRLSVDFRYQKASDPVMELVLRPHQGRLSWKQVYENWTSETHQFHWKKFSLNPVAKQLWPVQDTADPDNTPTAC